MRTRLVVVWLACLILAGCGAGVSSNPGGERHPDATVEILSVNNVDAGPDAWIDTSDELPRSNPSASDATDVVPGNDAIEAPAPSDASDGPGDVATEAPAPFDASDRSGDVAALDDASDAPPPFDTGAGGNCADRCAGDWPMPNPSATGLPHPQSYDTTRTDVVTDRVTGLVWQVATPANQFSWGEALEYCDGLILAGADDWRLPSRLELFSIVDVTRTYPAIDTTAFPDTPSAVFWTSSIVGGVPGMIKEVSFDLGNVYFSNMSARYQVRCVRPGDLDATNPPSRYVVSADTVLDSFTMLTWQRAVAPFDGQWLDAKTYCDNLVLADMGGWRLPSAGEINTLIDDSKFLPAVDTDAFPGRNETQWTSTLKSGDPSFAWILTFDRGFSWSDQVDKTYSFRCVR